MYLCSGVPDMFNVTEEDFSVTLTVSQAEIKEGEAFNLTCTVPPGALYVQNWLHLSKEVRVFPLQLMCSSTCWSHSTSLFRC